LTLGKKKIKIELEDADGGKYNLSLEGNMSKEKIMKVFELIEVLDIKGQDNNIGNNNMKSQVNKNLASVGSKIWGIVENKFPYTTFTSSDIQEIYEDEFNEPILLSIISTYLSRYCERRKVDRNKKGKEWIYKIARPSSVIETQAHRHEPEYHHPEQQQQQHLSFEAPSTVYDLHH
jgi:hypothetical protein